MVDITWKLFLLALLYGSYLKSASSSCAFGVSDRNAIYNFTLSSPSTRFPHGILSEDGYYKVAANGTIIWFQPCDLMIFNHDSPKCFDCSDCGGSSFCGTNCSALVSEVIGGYPVCRSIGHASQLEINLIDKDRPQRGVLIMMSTGSLMLNCSLSLSVVCNLGGVHTSKFLDKKGKCDYSAELMHPLGCPLITSTHGKGWGWFRITLVIILCILCAYLLVGTLYRFFTLGIRGIDAIPNLGFWIGLPRRLKNCYINLVMKVRQGPSRGYQSGYAPLNS